MTYEELLELNKAYNRLKRSHMNIVDDYKDEIEDTEEDLSKKPVKRSKMYNF